jgi:hypothetical protein
MMTAAGMMTMIDTSDSRFPKAVAIADQAGQWLKCRSFEGRKAYGVLSQRTVGHYYLVTPSSCTCEDAKRHPGQICKHSIAVQIHVARVAGQPMPASAVVGGLAEMVAARHPVLDMVRHPDGEITWERHNHPRPVADASTYERIFGRL